MVDEFERLGLEHAVHSPGSRNAPLLYSFGDSKTIRNWSLVDERSAGFFALGLARRSGSPVVLTCTSGSATANLMPAVVEAHEAGVPLIVLTADRPPELRGIGAGQAIDQLKLYGDYAKLFVEAGVHEVTDDSLKYFRSIACRAFATACSERPGAVHINLPLREPLEPLPNDDLDLDGPGAVGRELQHPWTVMRSAPREPWPELATELAAAERPLIVCGAQPGDLLANTLAQVAQQACIPVLVDVLSEARFGHHPLDFLIASYDLILRSERAREDLEPDLIVRIGETPTSKPLRDWLSRCNARQLQLDPSGSWREPLRSAAEIVRCNPTATFQALLPADGLSREPEWAQRWVRAAHGAEDAVSALLQDDDLSEAGTTRDLFLHAEDGASIVLASSMPVRLAETFACCGPQSLAVISNRGANGIDGTVSTAFGVAAAVPEERTYLLIGDLALHHDSNGLSAGNRLGVDLTIVCLDNNGGGIFSFLPIAKHVAHFESLVATPIDVDVEGLAGVHGLRYECVTNRAGLAAALKEPGIIHVRSDRTASHALHDALTDAAVAAVDRALANSN